LRVWRRNTFPPEISCRGASPNHAQKAFSLGHFLISRPISARIVWFFLNFGDIPLWNI
jgi:hypothetical protein